MGRIVIETDRETGLDHVELTLDDGSVLRFAGKGRSELHFVRGEQEWVSIPTTEGVDHKTPGLRHPDTWEFTLEVKDVPSIEKEGP